MPISFARAQSKLLNTNFLDLNADEKALYIVVEDTLEQYGALFLKALSKSVNANGVNASGGLLNSRTFTRKNGDKTSLILSMPSYYDFPNEGVRGVDSSTNAPTSPYRYKNYGMNAEGRASIKKYIQSGKAQIRNTGDNQVGNERKFKNKVKKSLIDSQVDNMIYLIKKYGIKTTRYFDEAYEEAFKDLPTVLSEMVGNEVTMSIVKSFPKKNK